MAHTGLLRCFKLSTPTPKFSSETKTFMAQPGKDPLRRKWILSVLLLPWAHSAHSNASSGRSELDEFEELVDDEDFVDECPGYSGAS